MAGHTNMMLVDQNNAEITLFFQVKLSYTYIVLQVFVLEKSSISDVHVEDGRLVDEVDGRRVEIGVGGLPHRKRKKMLFWIVNTFPILISLSTIMAM